MMVDYRQFDALGLAALVQRGELQPLELLEATLSAIEAEDRHLGAVVYRFAELAEAQIAAGIPKGPFQGVPLVIKDAGLWVKGTPSSFGSRLFAGMVCAADDTLALRLKTAGLLPFARSKSPEFALSFTTEPEAFGPTRNPWSPSRSSGGSSGGAAALVAAGLVPIAQASDGAGSIRVPAAHCGVFGFKPSRIRNPLGPRSAEGIAGMATPHAITRSVRDSAALLDATSGPDIGDPYAVAPSRRPFLQELATDPAPLRIGLIATLDGAADVDAECLAAANHAAVLCGQLGHRVEEAPLDVDGERFMRAWRLIAGVATAAATADAMAHLSADEVERRIEPVNLEWIEEGRRWTGTDYLQAVSELHRVGRQMGRFFERFDVLLSPTTAQLAPPIGFLAGGDATLDRFFNRFWSHGPFTAIFNASGCPAMSVPLYWTAPRDDAPKGLPVGVQFGAGPGQDGTLFALAGQLERAQPWFGRRAPIGASRHRPGELQDVKGR